MAPADWKPRIEQGGESEAAVAYKKPDGVGTAGQVPGPGCGPAAAHRWVGGGAAEAHQAGAVLDGYLAYAVQDEPVQERVIPLDDPGPASTLTGVNIALAVRRAPPLVGRWPRLLVLYGVIFPPAAVLTAIAFWPMWQDRPVLALGSSLLSLALLAAGILLLDEPAQQGPAIMLIGSSALLTAGWLDNWHAGPLPLISVPASPLGIVLASWAMFRYPNAPREVRVGLRFFLLIFVWLAVGEIASIVVARPRWAGFPASTWWPTLLPDHPAYTVISEIVDVGGVVFAVAYMFLWIRRWRRSRGISRGLAVPVAVAASVTCGITIVELVAAALVAGHQTMERIYAVEAYLQIAVPVAFVVSVLRRRFARTRIVELLLHLRGPARASSVTDALRTVFEDPDLEVIDSVPGPGGADDTSDAGRPGDGRLRLPVMSSSGEQLALILADPSLSANDEMVQAAVAASSFALENARLDTALQEQLQEVRESRLRIIEAGITERRKLERDLHDGTQQRLLALKIMLAAAEADLADDGPRPSSAGSGLSWAMCSTSSGTWPTGFTPLP